MARPFRLPDPNERSKNDPAVLVNSSKILGYYNQEHKDSGEKASYVSETVRNWYEEQAIAEGWSEVTFIGNQAMLKLNL